MEKAAFKMKLLPNQKEEYKKRRDEIMSELIKTFHDVGISDYSIYLDEETSILFGVLKRTKHHEMASLPEKEVMKKFWKSMENILETNTNGSVKVTQLECMFHMD